MYPYLDNKYTRWYYSIINTAQNQSRTKGSDVYYESHHIIPKSLGGSDKEYNRVLLTAKEHFVCHILLVKMVDSDHYRYKMTNALNIMSDNKRFGSRRFEFFREKYNRHLHNGNHHSYGIPLSKEHKMKISEAHKNRPCKEETRKKISESLKGKIVSQETREKMSSAFKNRKFSEETIIKFKSRVKSSSAIAAISKCYLITTPDGSQLEIMNLKDYCKYNNLSYSSMNKISRGVTKKLHKGYNIRIIS